MKLRRLLKEEKGAVLPFVALLLAFILIGFAAIVVDAGMLYNTKKEMVTAADAGALAGAKEMELALANPSTYNTAKAKAVTIARDVAIANGADEVPTAEVIKMNVNIGEGITEYRDVIRVVVSNNNQNFFAKIFGDSFNSSVVSSEAIATWGYARKVMGGSLFPLFMLEKDYLDGVDILHSEPFIYEGKTSNPNMGFIKLGVDANGKDIIKEALEGSLIEKTYILNSVLISETGNVQAIINSIEDRMKTANSLATIEERKQYMSGLVPIVHYDGTLQTNAANLTLPIQYFAVFTIKDIIVDYKSNGDVINGSSFALDDTTYKDAPGYIKYHEIIPKRLLPKGTIIGEFADPNETPVIYWADVEAGDQLPIAGFDITVTPKYSKLIK